MRGLHSWAVWIVGAMCIAGLVGCGDDGNGGTDGGPPGSDSGIVRIDAGTPGVDAGLRADAGTSADAGARLDAGVRLDAGFAIDAGPTRDAGDDAGDDAAIEDAGPPEIPALCDPTACTPTCFRAIRCVAECGGKAATCGCCACAEGAVDELSCSTAK